jgi:phosphoglucomutase
LVNYMLSAWEKENKFTGKEYIVKTIVTSDLIDKIAESKKITCYNTLTGFKFIGQIMTELQDKNVFIVGGEESYGYLVGDFVRDKDAVVSCAFIAEMTAFYKDQGSSLYEALLDMYVKYGFYKEKLVSITKKGKTGAEEIVAMMDRFRSNPPAKLGGAKVVTLKDYTLKKETDLISGKVKDIDLPKSDVLQFITEDGSIISARPSGTEPKIKFYCSVNTVLANKNDFKITEQKLEDKISTIMNDLVV